MKYVLVACECSQNVCKAFRSKGCLSFSCDIQPCYGGHREWHIVGDMFNVYQDNVTFFTEDGLSHFVPHWDLVIAHPPCTYLAKSGSCNLVKYVNGHRILDPLRYKKLLAARSFFIRIIDLRPAATYLCIENPIPIRDAQLPPPTQRVEPYCFGDNRSKFTYLWLYGGLEHFPLLVFSFTPPSGVISICKTHRSARLRSEFSPAIAKAMAERWACLE